MKQLVDEKERELIRTALDQTIIVEAAAGTGKTSELVQRIIRVLGKGLATVDQIVAVTFTEKAAGELKLRLRAGLENTRNGPEISSIERGNCEHALAHLEEARVATIHGFCADILRERPVEAGVDPAFEPLSEAESQRLYEEAFTLWLQHKLADPPEGVRRSLRRSSNEAGPTERLRTAGWTLASWRDFTRPWHRASFSRGPSIDQLVAMLNDFVDLTSQPHNPRNYFYRDTSGGRELSEYIRRTESVRSRDYDVLEARLVELAQDRKFTQPAKALGDEYAKGVPCGKVENAHRELVARLQGFGKAADADLAALLQHELLETIDAYEDLKTRTGRLDFVDLLLRTRNLVRDCDSVRADFQQRFTHIFVDEFQDTDPLQAEILLLLACADPATRSWREATPKSGKLFIVGDPKQSIYRFRRADVGTYLEVKRVLSERGALCIALTTSFRSTPSIQKIVNWAFQPCMNGDHATLQAEYVPLSPYREDLASQPSLIALPVPEPYGMKRIAASAIDRSLPDAVGGFVAWLLNDSGWTVTESERPTERLAIAPRHVCLLFRRFQNFGEDVTRAYVQALEARGVPHLLVGGKSFHTREEVEAVRTALTAIEWPDDELSVYATLRGTFFAVGDEALLVYRHQFGKLHPFRLPNGSVPELLVPVLDALRVLQSLHKGRNYRSIAETITDLLQTTRAHAAFVLRPSGEQVLANVLHVAELSRVYEESGGISFRGFVEQLATDAARGEAPEAPILEEGTEGIRMMTVHKAKGLEFPVVVLADITAKLGPSRASRYTDPERNLCAVRIAGWTPLELLENESEEIVRDRSEGVRLTYVAATRARDLLVIPSPGDPWDNLADTWIGPLGRVIFPPLESRRKATQRTGCPTFGIDSVKTRPMGVSLGKHTVSPGLHSVHEDSKAAGRGSLDIVWWDPFRLALGAAPHFSIRQQELLEEPGREVVERDLAAYREWEEYRKKAIEYGSEPTMTVQVATQYRYRTSDLQLPAVRLIEIDREPDRPSGVRFGTLVHAVLATTPLDASDKQLEEVAVLQGRVLGAPEDEVHSAVTVVRNVLTQPVMTQARKAQLAGTCRRETPVTLCAPDGTLIEGVVDLAFEQDGTWTVVDFKTDRELDRSLEDYKRQVALYAVAVARATGRNSLPILMRV